MMLKICVFDFSARQPHRNLAVLDDARPGLFALPNLTKARHSRIMHLYLFGFPPKRLREF
jgi:hypothetical protein